MDRVALLLSRTAATDCENIAAVHAVSLTVVRCQSVPM
jgi:hypothetical protein